MPTVVLIVLGKWTKGLDQAFLQAKKYIFFNDPHQIVPWTLWTEGKSIEETIHDLEDVYPREGFDLDPIEGLRETLFP